MLDPSRLAALPLFRELSPAARGAMAERAVERTYETGETLFTAGSAPAGLHVGTEGRVRVLRASAAGRRQVVHVEGPGGTLGEVPLYAGGGYPATAVAAEPGVAWLLLRRLALRVREVVVRELRRLRDAGVPRSTGRGKYVVEDLPRLRTLAHGGACR